MAQKNRDRRIDRQINTLKTQRQGDRETHRMTQKNRDRETETGRQRQTDKEIIRHNYINEKHKDKERHTE